MVKQTSHGGRPVKATRKNKIEHCLWPSGKFSIALWPTLIDAWEQKEEKKKCIIFFWSGHWRKTIPFHTLQIERRIYLCDPLFACVCVWCFWRMNIEGKNRFWRTKKKRNVSQRDKRAPTSAPNRSLNCEHTLLWLASRMQSYTRILHGFSVLQIDRAWATHTHIHGQSPGECISYRIWYDFQQQIHDVKMRKLSPLPILSRGQNCVRPDCRHSLYARNKTFILFYDCIRCVWMNARGPTSQPMYATHMPRAFVDFVFTTFYWIRFVSPAQMRVQRRVTLGNDSTFYLSECCRRRLYMTLVPFLTQLHLLSRLMRPKEK